MKNNLVKFVIVGVILILGIFLFSSVQSKQKTNENNPASTNISKKMIEIDHPEIFAWFQDQSSLCDESNITTSPEREAFCTDVNAFKEMSRFANIETTKNNLFTIFTIETDILAPDTVVGIHNKMTDEVTMLSDYYLGNDFINFSPDESFVVYRRACFESKCGFEMYDLRTESATSESVIAMINIPEFLDAREENAVFVEWTSDKSFAYKIGEESLTMTLE